MCTEPVAFIDKCSCMTSQSHVETASICRLHSLVPRVGSGNKTIWKTQLAKQSSCMCNTVQTFHASLHDAYRINVYTDNLYSLFMRTICIHTICFALVMGKLYVMVPNRHICMQLEYLFMVNTFKNIITNLELIKVSTFSRSEINKILIVFGAYCSQPP